MCPWIGLKRQGLEILLLSKSKSTLYVLIKCSQKDYSASFTIYRISFSNHLLGQFQGRNNVATNPTQVCTTPVSNGWSASLRRAVAQEQQLFSWRTKVYYTGKHWTTDTRSPSTEPRCEDSASFSKLAEGNTGTITPPLPNPQIILIQKSIQMVE